MIEAKLEKCLKYGQLRERQNFQQNYDKYGKINTVEAPCIFGNQKKIEIRLIRSRKSFTNMPTRLGSRPKTTNTVIRSRTSEPRIR